MQIKRYNISKEYFILIDLYYESSEPVSNYWYLNYMIRLNTFKKVILKRIYILVYSRANTGLR